MHKITDKLTQVKRTIQQAAESTYRNPNEITLLAVSKKQSAQSIAIAYTAGQNNFGENYLQEALDKIDALKDLDICWHFIGPIQSNKTRSIAENFSWVHSIDREKVAQRLNDQRPDALPPLNVCIQVNIDREPSKSGVYTEHILPLAEKIWTMPNLTLRGLMAIPTPPSEQAKRDIGSPTHRHNMPSANLGFEAVQKEFKRLQQHKPASSLDTLSMGMSNDLSEAILYGATIVRVGTGIFGQRI